MKRKYFLFISLICLIPFFISCEKEKVEKPIEPIIIEGEGIKLNKEQKIYNLASANLKKITSKDTVNYNGFDFPTYELEIEAISEEIDQIVPGTVIYVPHGTRGGMLVFVYEIETTGNPGGRTAGPVFLIINGIQATLDMYFNYENASLEFTTPENRSKINSDFKDKLTSPPVSWGDIDIEFKSKFENTGLSVKISDDTLFKANFESRLWEEGKSYINVNGSFSVNPSLDFLLEYQPIKVKKGSGLAKNMLKWLEAGVVPDALLASYNDINYYLGNMKQLQATIYTDVDKELTFEMHLEKKLEKEVEIPIGSLTIPSAPVSAQFEMSFVIDFSVFGSLDFEAYANEENDIVFGVNLDRDLPDPVWFYEFDSKEESGCKLKAEVEITTGIKLVLEAEVYVLGVMGPEVTAEAFLEASANIKAIAGTVDETTVSWYLSVDAGVRGNASLNLSAFHVDDATWKFWTIVSEEFRQNVYLAPKYIQVEQGNDQTGMIGQTLQKPIVVGAYDSRDKLITYLPVPIHFEAQHGSTNPSGLTWTTDGQASTQWTLGNEIDVQILKAYLKDGEENVAEISIEANANGNSNSLIAHYPFNNNANDESGNGHDGIVNGAIPTTDRFGNVNSAYSFDGTNDYIEVLHKDELEFTDEFTISTWVYSIDATTNQLIVTKGYHRNSLRYATYLTNDQNSFRTVVGTTNTIADDYVSEPFNEWIHVVGLYKDGVLKSYVNKELAGTLNVDFSTIPSTTANVLIGKLAGEEQYFNGKIDDIQIYNYAIDESEINSLYSEGGWTGNQDNPDLLAYYPFNGNTNDESGNGYNGVLVGATLATDRNSITNSAYYFDGIDDFIDLPNPYDNDNFTVNVWVKVDPNDLGGVRVLDGWNKGELFAVSYGYMNYSNNATSFVNYDGIGNYAFGSIHAWKDNTNVYREKHIFKNSNLDGWHMLTVSYDYPYGRFYFDSNLVSEVDYNSVDSYYANGKVKTDAIKAIDVEVGKNADGVFFKGWIDDIGLYKKALTQTEIINLFSGN